LFGVVIHTHEILLKPSELQKGLPHIVERNKFNPHKMFQIHPRSCG